MKIDRKLIRKASKEATRLASFHQGFLLNVADDEDRVENSLLFLYHSKASFQGQHLTNQIEKIHTNLLMLSEDGYVASWEELDPYDVLDDYFNSGLVTDLPRQIAEYAEFSSLCDYLSMRQMSLDALANTFLDLERVLADDSALFVPKHLLSRNEMGKIESARMYHAVDLEHCLDPYEKWRESLIDMICIRAPFNEMLTLFK